MDFLRRLTPLRPTDATRAVAVLPSRFASESPLRATIGQAQRLDGDEAPPSLDASADSHGEQIAERSRSAPAETNALAAQHPLFTSIQPPQAAPRPLGHGNGPTPRDDGKVTSSTRTAAGAPDTGVARSRGVLDRPGTKLQRDSLGSPELQGLAGTLRVGHALQGSVVAPPAQPRADVLQGVAAPPAQPRADVPLSRSIPAAALAARPNLHSVTAPLAPPLIALPLSQSTLAQRRLAAQDDNQVVHVTIGRIEVVASAAPAPASRRSPTPRQATVTLTDYLRGGHEGRR